MLKRKNWIISHPFDLDIESFDIFGRLDIKICIKFVKSEYLGII